VCFNDMVAMGVYRSAHELSLEIPRDLSVVGHDGVDFAGLLAPPLTSVDIFPEVLGKRSAEVLMRLIRNEAGRSIITQWIQPEIIERGSVRGIVDNRSASPGEGAGLHAAAGGG